MFKKRKVVLGVLAFMMLILGASVTVTAAQIGADWTLGDFPVGPLFLAAGIVLGLVCILAKGYALARKVSGVGAVILLVVGTLAFVDTGAVIAEIDLTADWDVNVNITTDKYNSNMTLSGDIIYVRFTTNKTEVSLLQENCTFESPSGDSHPANLFLYNVIATFTVMPTGLRADNTEEFPAYASVGEITKIRGTSDTYDMITHSGTGANTRQHINWTQGGRTRNDRIDFTVTYGTSDTIVLEVDPYPLAFCQLDEYATVQFDVDVCGTIYTIVFTNADAWGTLP